MFQHPKPLSQSDGGEPSSAPSSLPPLLVPQQPPPPPSTKGSPRNNHSPRFFLSYERVVIMNLKEYCLKGGTNHKVIETCVLLKQLKDMGIRIILLTNDKDTDMEIFDDYPEKYLFHGDFRVFNTTEDRQTMIQSLVTPYRKSNSGKNLFKPSSGSGSGISKKGSSGNIPFSISRRSSGESSEVMTLGRKSSGEGSSLLSTVLHRRSNSQAMAIPVKSLLSVVVFDSASGLKNCCEVNEGACRIIEINKGNDKHIEDLKQVVNDFKRQYQEKLQQEKEEENRKRRSILLHELKAIDISQDLLKVTYNQLYAKACWGFVGEMVSFCEQVKSEQTLMTTVNALLPGGKLRIEAIPDDWDIYQSLSRCMVELTYPVSTKSLKLAVFQFFEREKHISSSWVAQQVELYSNKDVQFCSMFKEIHTATDQEIERKKKESLYEYNFITWDSMDFIGQIVTKIYPQLIIHVIFPQNDGSVIYYMIDNKGVAQFSQANPQIYQREGVIHLLRYERLSSMFSNPVSHFIPLLRGQPQLAQASVSPRSGYSGAVQNFLVQFKEKMSGCIETAVTEHRMEFQPEPSHPLKNTVFVKPMPGNGQKSSTDNVLSSESSTEQYAYCDFKNAEEQQGAVQRFRQCHLQVLESQITQMRQIIQKHKTLPDFLQECLTLIESEKERLWGEWQSWCEQYSVIDHKRQECRTELNELGQERDISASMIFGNVSVNVGRSRDIFVMASDSECTEAEFRAELRKMKKNCGNKFDINTFGQTGKQLKKSLLQRACVYGVEAAVRILVLEEKADVNHRVTELDSPAIFYLTEFMAINARGVALLTLLLDAGADPLRYNSQLQTAIHFAASKNCYLAMEEYFARGIIRKPGSVNFYVLSRVNRNFGSVPGHRAIYEAIICDHFGPNSVVHLSYSYGIGLTNDELILLANETSDKFAKLMKATLDKARISPVLIAKLKENPGYLVERMIEVLKERPEHFKKLLLKLSQDTSKPIKASTSSRDLKSSIKDHKQEFFVEEASAPEECAKAELEKLYNAWMAKLVAPDKPRRQLARQGSLIGLAMNMFSSSSSPEVTKNSRSQSSAATLVPLKNPAQTSAERNDESQKVAPSSSESKHQESWHEALLSTPPSSTPPSPKGSSIIVTSITKNEKTANDNLNFDGCDEVTGLSILHLACIRGDKKLFETAMEKPALRTMCSKYGFPPIYYACKYRQYAFVTRLLESKVPLTPTEAEITNLIQAEKNVEKNHRRLADYGRNALHAAVENDDINLVRQLLDYVFTRENYSCLYGRDQKLHSPLMKAVLRKNKEIMRLFRDAGIRVVDKIDAGNTLAQMNINAELAAIVRAVDDVFYNEPIEELKKILEKIKRQSPPTASGVVDNHPKSNDAAPRLTPSK